MVGKDIYKEKFFKYYGLWLGMHKTKSKAIFILSNKYKFKNRQIADMFDLSDSRIKQILDKEKRSNYGR